MLRRGRILFFLLVASLMTMTTIHVQESPRVLSLECNGFVHYEGDTDQSSGDADKAVSHHHSGCHGHHISAFTDGPVSSVPVPSDDLLIPLTPVDLTHTAIETPLRPPIA